MISEIFASEKLRKIKVIGNKKELMLFTVNETKLQANYHAKMNENVWHSHKSVK